MKKRKHEKRTKEIKRKISEERRKRIKEYDKEEERKRIKRKEKRKNLLLYVDFEVRFLQVTLPLLQTVAKMV
jgi:hypothetical protein